MRHFVVFEIGQYYMLYSFAKELNNTFSLKKDLLPTNYTKSRVFTTKHGYPPVSKYHNFGLVMDQTRLIPKFEDM